MKIYVLPVSGGGFAVQIGFLKVINEASSKKDISGIKPDLVLGSSGGQVSAYLAMIGNWNYTAILKNIHLVNSTLFVESWTPPFFPTWIAFPLTQSIYNSGDGVKNLFHRVFTPRSITTTEIWSGTYNSTTQKAALFCNLSFDKAKIKDKDETKYIYDSEKSTYMDGDIDLVAKAAYASASIPYITPGVIINDEKHIDGGAAYASPIVPLKTKVADIIKRKPKTEPIQVYHFASYDMNEKFSDSLYSNSIGLLIHSILLQERATTLDLLKEVGVVDPTPDQYMDVNCQKLSAIFEVYANQSYLMMFSPKRSPSITVTSFSGIDIAEIIQDIEKDFTVLVWKLTSRY